MRYMLLIYGPDVEPMPLDDPSAAEALAPWNEYTKWLIDNGLYVAGEQLAPTTSATNVRVQHGQRLVTDGPFAETKEVLGGYYIVECDDLDTALEAAARCPGAQTGTMEVRPLVGMAADPAAQGHAN